MADIEQSLQEIQQERSRLLTAKENLKTAITGKGVTVADDAKLDEYYTFVNGIQQGVEGGIDVSATTATEADVLSTAKFYKADGSFVSGNIQTVTPTLSGNVFSVGKGYVPENKELTVPEAPSPTVSGNIVTVYPGYVPKQASVEIPKATATLSANVMTINAGYHDQNTLIVAESVITATETKVTIGVGYVGEAKEYNLGTDNVAGVLVDDNGVLKVQKLSFDGTVASDGEIVEADKFYLFETGHDEPDYGSGGSSGGGSMEIYKCAAVHEATAGDGYVITGAGDAVLNGTYAVTEQSDTEVEYKNENGAVLLHLIGSQWMLFDDQWSQRWDSNNVDYDSAADVPSWNCYVGEYPEPTVKALASEPSWSGYLYNTETKQFSDMLTVGLEYKMAAPIVGKCYNADATMSIEYVPLAGIPNENIILNYPMTDLKLNANNGFLFTDGGVPELITDGIARLRISYGDGYLKTQKTLLQGLSEFTVSLCVNFYTMPSGEKSWIFYESGYQNYARTLVDVNRDSNNHIGFHVRDTTTGDTGTWRSVYSSTVIQANKFYHIAVVYSAEEQSLYINGALEYKGAGGALLTDSTSPSNGGITIGPDKPCVEDITHLRVFSKALNAEQVTILYNELSRIVTE